METKIAVVGSLNMDLVVRAAHFPQPGETILGMDFATAPGGKGANQAVAAARMGGSVSMIGRVGNDAFGRELLDNLKRDGVSCDGVLTTGDVRSGVALIVVDAQGQNSIVVASGANAALSPADIEAAAEHIRQSDCLLLQLEIPLESVIRAVEIARESKVPVVLNPAPACPLPAELLASVDILVPNETETAFLTGLPSPENEDEDALFAAAEALHALGVPTVIMTLGSRGALLSKRGLRKLVPAFHIEPVDTTAAGDAFLGGFAVAFTEGKSLEEAVRQGNAAGALAATKPGAQPSLPFRGKVLDLLTAGLA